MSKKKENNSPAVQRLTGKELLQRYWHLLFALIVLTIAGMWAGYSIEDVGGFQKMMKSPEKFVEQYLTLSNFGKAFLQLLTFKGGAVEGIKYGFLAGIMVFFGFAKTGKRFHRKGVEHGSARWGNQAEKDIIADTNDFFNNVICSSDVILVLDRKKRDENAMTDKELAEYKRKKELAKNAELERIKALADEFGEIEKQYDYVLAGEKNDENRTW